MSFNWRNEGLKLFLMPLAFLAITPVIYFIRGVQFGFGNDFLYMYPLYVFAPAFFIIASTCYFALGSIESRSQTPSESQR